MDNDIEMLQVYYSNYCDNERAGVARAVQKNKRPLKTFRQRIKVLIFLALSRFYLLLELFYKFLVNI